MPEIIQHIRAAKTHLRLIPVALLMIASIIGACDDPNNVPGVSELATQPFFLHALTGSPFDGSTAISFPTRAVTRVDGNFDFDIAFDINSQGQIVLLPPELVGQNPGGNRLVGIMTGVGLYDSINQAPLLGYTVDSATIVSVGQAFVSQAQETACLTANPAAPYLYAKLVVDSIDLIGRGIYGRAMIGGDCGYRQLVAGFPTF
jgi:hypothetical protein